MKLLLESWRKYLNEVEMQDATMLSIFDFDETIAFTTSYADAFDKDTGEFVKRIYSQITNKCLIINNLNNFLVFKFIIIKFI